MSTHPYWPEDKWVDTNGVRLHYLDWGGDRTKKPLYLVHGLSGTALQWVDFAPLLSETHHVIAIDLRGHGDSDWSREGYSVQLYAADIAAFARATGLYPFDYFGHSQGSRVGMPVGAYYGDLVDHLVLGDYGPMPDPSPAGKATAAARGGNTPPPKGFFSPEQAFEWHRERDEDASDEEIWRVVKRSYRTNWDSTLVSKTDPEALWLRGRTALKEGDFLWDCVGKISCKTLVLRGGESNVLDREQAEKMAATIPNGNGSLHELDGVGHGLHREDVDTVRSVLGDFFAS